ncbi:hypothetical protein [Pseudophaeobacter flagellatus]|uniref:hypothetical protein n=1 Tax=Pseudophaeobacter flagellatus TaxID=2899119 RepID=UPI001E3928E0|nr:hypothetical protein [Pseudophaeobacter flagellatus]MCD9149826.1 hypothetical protein [Pseudophaeobacter flagellatus]
MDMDGFFGWASKLSGDVSFFVAPIVQPPSGTFLGNLLSDAAPSLLGAVVGGGIAFCVARWSFNRAADTDARRREDDRLGVGAESAYSGYVKLWHWVNLLANQKALIDGAYEYAEKSGHPLQEPCDVVPAFAGRSIEPDFLKPCEYSFLVKGGETDLIADLHLLEQRAANIASLILQYSQLAIEFERWRESVTMQRAVFANRVVDAIPPNLEGVEQGKRANMNGVMGAIRSNLEVDLPFGDKTVQQFINAAHHHYGERFPDMKFGEPDG